MVCPLQMSGTFPTFKCGGHHRSVGCGIVFDPEPLARPVELAALDVALAVASVEPVYDEPHEPFFNAIGEGAKSRPMVAV